MFVPRLEGASSDNIDSCAQEFFKVLEQADMIKQTGTRFKIREQIQIAVCARLSPSEEAESGSPR